MLFNYNLSTDFSVQTITVTESIYYYPWEEMQFTF